MKRFRLILAASTVITLGLGGAALAADMGSGEARHNRVGPGFHSLEAPLGIRWWLSNQKLALDLGFGFSADNFSVSAAHGIGLRRFNPGFGADSQTSFGTRGNNFTTTGFHIYMFR